MSQPHNARVGEVILSVEWGLLVIHGGLGTNRANVRRIVRDAGVETQQAHSLGFGGWVARSVRQVSSINEVRDVLAALRNEGVSTRMVAGVLSTGPGGNPAVPPKGVDDDGTLRTIMSISVEAVEGETVTGRNARALLHWQLEVRRSNLVAVGDPVVGRGGIGVIVLGVVDDTRARVRHAGRPGRGTRPEEDALPQAA